MSATWDWARKFVNDTTERILQLLSEGQAGYCQSQVHVNPIYEHVSNPHQTPTGPVIRACQDTGLHPRNSAICSAAPWLSWFDDWGCLLDCFHASGKIFNVLLKDFKMIIAGDKCGRWSVGVANSSGGKHSRNHSRTQAAIMAPV